MIQPDGIAYFYSPTPLHPALEHHSHSLLYAVKFRGWFTCGVCLLKQGIETEIPEALHEKRELADNGNPQMKPRFVYFLERSLGLAAPRPDQTLRDFNLARKQYTRVPDRKSSPVTFALWDMFGKQPRMAEPLLKSILGATDTEIAEQLDLSIYQVQISISKAVNMAVRYLNASNRR